MVRRAYAPSGEQHQLTDWLRWHIHQMLHHDGMGAVLVLRPVVRAAPDERYVVGFDPLADAIRARIRRSDLLEVDAENGIGIVLSGTSSEGARAVFLRLRDALCSPIPPVGPHEVSAPVAFGYAVPAAFAAGDALVADKGCAAHAGGDDAISPLEATCTAMVHAAWQPQLVLPLTLPLLRRTPQPATRACGKHGVETEPSLPRHRAKRDVSLPAEQTPQTEDESGAMEAVAPAQQHTAHRGHLRLVTNSHIDLPELELLQALARTMGIPFVRMPTHLPRSCRTALHPTVACELRAVPIGRTRGTLTVAMHDPSDQHAVRRLHTLTGLNIFPVLAAPDEIDHALRRMLGG